MTITQRQFNHLNEMGIQVWQQRNTNYSSENLASKNTSTPIVKPLPVDLPALCQQTLFTDIMHCIDISIGELTTESNQINLGLFNWQFIDADSISFKQSTLTTPPITAFEHSTQLKRDLWQIIQQEVLT